MRKVNRHNHCSKVEGNRRKRRTRKQNKKEKKKPSKKTGAFYFPLLQHNLPVDKWSYGVYIYFMKHSESIKTISPALLKAQKKIGSAKKGSVNPFFKSSYADLGAVMEACKDPLNENGIAILQPIGTNGDVYVETVLLHESGEWISDRMAIAPKSETNPQDQGSAITYARRYSLQSMVFIPAEDDDGEKATKPLRGTTTKKTKEPTSFAGENGEALRDSKGHTACVSCARAVSTRVEKYSMDKHNKILCVPCQAKEKGKAVK